MFDSWNKFQLLLVFLKIVQSIPQRKWDTTVALHNFRLTLLSNQPIGAELLCKYIHWDTLSEHGRENVKHVSD